MWYIEEIHILNPLWKFYWKNFKTWWLTVKKSFCGGEKFGLGLLFLFFLLVLSFIAAERKNSIRNDNDDYSIDF